MAQTAKKKQDAAILDAISRYPQGASVAEVHRELESVSRRTLARRLTELVKEKRLLRRGKARATRYFLSSESSSQAIQPRGMHSEMSFGTPGIEASILSRMHRTRYAQGAPNIASRRCLTHEEKDRTKIGVCCQGYPGRSDS